MAGEFPGLRGVSGCRPTRAPIGAPWLYRMARRGPPPCRIPQPPLSPPLKRLARSALNTKARSRRWTHTFRSLNYWTMPPDGSMKTADLIHALENWFAPRGEDAEILAGRSDTRFSQIVRNVVSH